MNERRSLLVLVVLLALVAGLLTWAVVGPGRKCSAVVFNVNSTTKWKFVENPCPR